MEEYIMNRISQIMEEYAQLKNLADYDLTLEAIGDSGDVSITLKKGLITFERTICFKEDLSFVSETFSYPDTFHPRSKDIALDTLEIAYFNELGRLVVEHKDSTEVFKVKDAQRDEVRDLLKEKLGSRFGKPSKVAPIKQLKKVNQELMYQIYYTLDGKESYFIVSSDTEQGAKTTALDLIKQRGLDLKENKIFSKFINN